MSLAGLIYVHLGYPAVLAVLARRAPKRSPARDDPPRSVSFIISAYNERTVIEEKIRNTLALDPPPTEVVVVADGSTDGTERAARGIADDRVQVLYETERRGKSAAINRGVARATGEVVVLSDANNHYAHDALVHLLAPFGDPAVGGVTGQRRVVGVDGLTAGEGVYGRYERTIRELESALGACTAASGEIMALRSECFTPIPPDVSTDDLFLAMAVLGQRRTFVFSSGAECFESAAATDGAEFERRSRFSAARLWLVARRGFVTQGGPRVAWQFISHKVGRLLVPFFFVGALVGALRGARDADGRRGLLALGSPWGLLAAAVQLLGWAFGVVARLAPSALPARLRSAGAAIWFLLVGNLAILNGWWRFVRGRREVVWRRVERAASPGGGGDGEW